MDKLILDEVNSSFRYCVVRKLIYLGQLEVAYSKIYKPIELNGRWNRSLSSFVDSFKYLLPSGMNGHNCWSISLKGNTLHLTWDWYFTPESVISLLNREQKIEFLDALKSFNGINDEFVLDRIQRLEKELLDD